MLHAANPGFTEGGTIMTQSRALQDPSFAQANLAGRIFAFLSGIAAYGIFFVTFLFAIGFVEGMGVPKTIDGGAAGPPARALVVDLVLLSIFALQHSVMARPQFKRWWTQFVPRSVERTTYVLAASLALALLIWQWQPMPTPVWQIGKPALALTVTGVSFLGFLIVLSSTF